MANTKAHRISISITADQKQYLKDNKNISPSGLFQKSLDALREGYSAVIEITEKDNCFEGAEHKLLNNEPGEYCRIFSYRVPGEATMHSDPKLKMFMDIVDKDGKKIEDGVFQLRQENTMDTGTVNIIASNQFNIFLDNRYKNLYKHCIIKSGHQIMIRMKTSKEIDIVKSRIMLPFRVEI